MKIYENGLAKYFLAHSTQHRLNITVVCGQIYNNNNKNKIPNTFFNSKFVRVQIKHFVSLSSACSIYIYKYILNI